MSQQAEALRKLKAAGEAVRTRMTHCAGAGDIAAHLATVETAVRDAVGAGIPPLVALEVIFGREDVTLVVEVAGSMVVDLEREAAQAHRDGRPSADERPAIPLPERFPEAGESREADVSAGAVRDEPANAPGVDADAPVAEVRMMLEVAATMGTPLTDAECRIAARAVSRLVARARRVPVRGEPLRRSVGCGARRRRAPRAIRRGVHRTRAAPARDGPPPPSDPPPSVGGSPPGQHGRRAATAWCTRGSSTPKSMAGSPNVNVGRGDNMAAVCVGATLVPGCGLAPKAVVCPTGAYRGQRALTARQRAAEIGEALHATVLIALGRSAVPEKPRTAADPDPWILRPRWLGASRCDVCARARLEVGEWRDRRVPVGRSVSGCSGDSSRTRTVPRDGDEERQRPRTRRDGRPDQGAEPRTRQRRRTKCGAGASMVQASALVHQGMPQWGGRSEVKYDIEYKAIGERFWHRRGESLATPEEAESTIQAVIALGGKWARRVYRVCKKQATEPTHPELVRLARLMTTADAVFAFWNDEDAEALLLGDGIVVVAVPGAPIWEGPRGDRSIGVIVSAIREQVRADRERAERAQWEQAQQERADRERADREHEDQERAARERADRTRWEQEQQERADRERADREQEDQERAERERADRVRWEKEQRERAERERADRAHWEQEQQERVERERADWARWNRAGCDRAAWDDADDDRIERRRATR